VARSCFAQLHQIQSLDDHVQHQGAHFHKHDYPHQIDVDGCDSPKWRVVCLIFWLSLSSDLLLMLVWVITGAGTVREVTIAS